MTNEQLLIDRRQLRARLEAAIEQAKELLPTETETVRPHKADIFASCFGRRCSIDTSPDHYLPGQERRIDPLALTPLVDLLDSLDADIATLTPKT